MDHCMIAGEYLSNTLLGIGLQGTGGLCCLTLIFVASKGHSEVRSNVI